MANCGSGAFQIGEDKYFFIFRLVTLLPVFWDLYMQREINFTFFEKCYILNENAAAHGQVLRLSDAGAARNTG